jgi:LacI family transcriptional regulator
MVAEHANVSNSTVSRVLNNNPKVAEHLRERVLEAVETLGYRPDRIAQRLRSSTEDVLGLIVSDIQNPFFTSVVRGVEDTAYEQGMSVVLCNTDENPAKQRNYLRVMQAERIAGLIIAPTPTDDKEPLVYFRDLGVPLILLDRLSADLGSTCDAVLVDNFQGAYAGVKHLIDLGYRRIGYISSALTLTTGRERYRGYQEALGNAGIAVDETVVEMGNSKIDDGYRIASKFITLPNPPDAFFVANNLMTIGALQALHEYRVRIPEDAALIGFDDMAWASVLSPPLTTIAQPAYEMGKEAAQLLLRRLSEPDAPLRTVVLKPQLVVRESCGAALGKREAN